MANMHDRLAPLLKSSLTAFSYSFNQCKGVWDFASLTSRPDGVDLHEALCARYCLSTHENVQLLALDGKDFKLDVHCLQSITNLYSAGLAHTVRALAVVRGAPTREQMESVLRALASGLFPKVKA
jgi:hypothetical protein